VFLPTVVVVGEWDRLEVVALRGQKQFS